MFSLIFTVLAQQTIQQPTLPLDFNPSTLTLTNVLSFFMKFFFTIAALVALLYLLLGAFAWITSGGSKENIEKAREKIQAAVIGIVLIVAVIAIVVTLEQVVFKQVICFGLSCGIKIPGLIQ